jgi:hypothetical protein
LVLSLFLAVGPALAMVDSPRLEEVTCQMGGEEVELAEAIHEFDRPCPDGTAGRSHTGGSGVVVAAVAVLAAGLVAGGRALRVLLRHPGGG